MNTTLVIVAVVVLLAALFWLRDQATVEALSVHAPAPDFTLPDADGKPRSLADFKGEWLLLYFYPKDDTPGCTKEACAFRDGYLELRQRSVQVVGVSLDDGRSHREFAEKYKLPFPLLSDPDGKVAGHYGALWSMGPVRFARRHSFLIDPDGALKIIYRDVNPETHYSQVLTDLQRMDLP